VQAEQFVATTVQSVMFDMLPERRVPLTPVGPTPYAALLKVPLLIFVPFAYLPKFKIVADAIVPETIWEV